MTAVESLGREGVKGTNREDQVRSGAGLQSSVVRRASPQPRSARSIRSKLASGDSRCLNPAMDQFLEEAIEEAKKGLAAGGIPIGSVLVCEDKIIGRGHNQRVQRGSVIRHAEMDCLENAGRLKAS